ncbi:hypothetical protein EP51_04050 [Rhodococcus opacus]|uniref:Uncharacterized protein n=1 Tax=Rhodococcus opacus TaxID=37919 RepID=A0A076EDX2_RHOOP|nr:hypothetical protein EP51_04050 [Rhodococcus opacus]
MGQPIERGAEPNGVVERDSVRAERPRPNVAEFVRNEPIDGAGSRRRSFPSPITTTVIGGRP